jgi:predicted NBD/HSP70 family sugar kinase
MEPNRFRHYIGIDWATEAHRICLLDHNGQLCAKVSIPHSGAGRDQLLEWLASHGVEPRLRRRCHVVQHGRDRAATVEGAGFLGWRANPQIG